MTLEISGAKVDITIKGDTGRGLLLLHGWMCSAQMMAFIQDAFADRMRTVAVDFPGHGKEGKAAPPPEPWGVQDYAEMTAALIRELDLAPCDIIAHSFGCRVAIVLAAEHPELVGHMILTGAAGLRKPIDEAQKRRQSAYKTLRAAVDGIEKAHLFQRQIPAWREALVQRYGSEDYKQLTPEMRQTFNRVVTQDLSDYLPRIKASTLLYWGAKDTETPLWMGQRMEKEIPDAGLVVEEGVGHFAYLEKQAAFLRIASYFLLEGREE